MSVKELVQFYQSQAEEEEVSLTGVHQLNMRFPKASYVMLKLIAERLDMPPTTLACNLLEEAVREAAEVFGLSLQDPEVMSRLREAFGLDREDEAA